MEGIKGLSLENGQIYQAEKIDNDQKVTEIAGKLLGKKGGEGYSSQYDPSLLVRIPRSLNREIYGIKEDDLPFVGMDVWNGYEVTALTEKGLPVAGVAKILIPAYSKYHPESKSIKMYVNSFAMSKFGQTEEECVAMVENTVREDLSELLECKVGVKIFTGDIEEVPAENSLDHGTFNLDRQYGIDEMEFTDYNMNPGLLEPSSFLGICVKSNKLRSACRVTHQPDHGTVYIIMDSDKGGKCPTDESLLKFIVSFRNEYHFHEEICEAIFKTLNDRFHPDKLMVACNYTRRGGWDINPIRAKDWADIPREWTDATVMLAKTIKQ